MRRAIALLISAILFVSMLVVGIAPKTQAQTGDPVTLISPVLPVNITVTELFDCFILNTGSSTETGTIEVFSDIDTLLASKTVTLLPGTVGLGTLNGVSFPLPLPPAPTPGGYCKFIFPKGTFRASVDIRDCSILPCKVLVALPAF